MNKRGFGSVYLRGRTYWIRYWYRGKEYRESSGSDNEAQAVRLLKNRIKQMGRPRFIGPSEERVTFEDLAEMVRVDYRVNNRRSVNKVNVCLAHLSEAFALARAVDITTAGIEAYIAARQQTRDDGRRGAANATINRELAALKRASVWPSGPSACLAPRTFQCSRNTKPARASSITPNFLR